MTPGVPDVQTAYPAVATTAVAPADITRPHPFAPYAWMLVGCFSFAWMSEFGYRLGSGCDGTVARCDWRVIAFARGFLAFVFALTMAKAAGAKLVFRGTPVLWLRSCMGSLSLLCTFFALTQLRTAEVLTLTNTFPIWVAILSWPLLSVRPALSVWLAAVCGVLGIVLIRRPDVVGLESSQWPVMLSLSAALTSALAMLGLHRLKGLHPWAIVVHFSGVATAFVLGAILVGYAMGESIDFAPVWRTESILLLLGVGLTATLGQLCLTRAFTLGQPAKVSVVGLSQIVMALGLDYAMGRPAFDPTTFAGIGLVLAPTAWVMAGKAAEA